MKTHYVIKALQPLLERTSWIVGCAVICASCQSPLGAESPSVEDQVIEARLDTSYHDLGVRPDCTEEAISYQELLELAQSVNPDIPDPQQAFLDALPAGALQTFTLVFDSESAQSRGISSEWPGIIRMTQDGQLTIRYTCDRSVSSTYGKVEVIHFDPVTQRFGFTELNLMSSDRVKQEPLQCYGCHNIDRSTEDARPNWNMYPNWKGFFGSHDDFFPQGTPEEASLVGHAPDWLPPNHSEEKDRYQQFIQAHVITNPDPCYMSLPWPTPWRVGGVTPERFTQYPYGTQSGNARQRLYALRPNLKLTEIYSKRLAQRNFRRLRQHPQYEEVKVLLALEAASCDQRSLHPELDQRQNAQVSQEWLDTRIATLLPNYTRAAGEQPRAITLRGRSFFHHDPRHQESRAQALYGVWRAFGYQGGEWSLVPFEYHEPQYATGAGPGANQEFPADLPLTAYLQYELLVDVLGERDDLFTRSTGEADDFGDHFSCIDEQGGAKVFRDEAAWRATCDELLILIDSPSRGPSRSAPSPPPPPRDLPRQRGPDEPLDEYLEYLSEF